MLRGREIVVLALCLAACKKEPRSGAEATSGSHAATTSCGRRAPGAGLIVITVGAPSKPSSLSPFSLADVDAIRAVPGVCEVAPVARRPENFLAADASWSTLTTASDPSYLAVRGWKLAEGRAFSDGAEVVLGQTTVKQLFGGADALGQTVRIKDVPLEVVGVLAPLGMSLLGQDQDDVALVSLGFIQRKQAALAIANIWVGAASDDDTPGLLPELARVLRESHKLRPGQDDDFQIRDVATLMRGAHR
jgi:putative ABC transport system permease protein